MINNEELIKKSSVYTHDSKGGRYVVIGLSETELESTNDWDNSKYVTYVCVQSKNIYNRTLKRFMERFSIIGDITQNDEKFVRSDNEVILSDMKKRFGTILDHVHNKPYGDILSSMIAVIRDDFDDILNEENTGVHDSSYASSPCCCLYGFYEILLRYKSITEIKNNKIEEDHY